MVGIKTASSVRGTVTPGKGKAMRDLQNIPDVALSVGPTQRRKFSHGICPIPDTGDVVHLKIQAIFSKSVM